MAATTNASGKVLLKHKRVRNNSNNNMCPNVCVIAIYHSLSVHITFFLGWGGHIPPRKTN